MIKGDDFKWPELTDTGGKGHGNRNPHRIAQNSNLIPLPAARIGWISEDQYGKHRQ